MRTRTILLCVALLSALPGAAAAADNDFWLVTQIAGRWEYKQGNEKPRELKTAYEPLHREGEVRCLESDLRRCSLGYLTGPKSDATARLNVRLRETGEWVSLSTLKPPPAAILPATSSELAKRFRRETRPGGSRAGSACGGDLQLKAPTCGETIDVEGFTVVWSLGPVGSLAILVEAADGNSGLFRAVGAASNGEFSDRRLTAFLRKLQSTSNSVDVLVTVTAGGGRKAVRLVRLPPTSQTDGYEGRLRAAGDSTAVPVTVTRMTLALEEGMWSRAADQGRRLLASGDRSAAVLEYALTGICQSDFEDEKASLRRALRASRYTELCGDGAPTPPSTEVAVRSATLLPTPAAAAPSPAAVPSDPPAAGVDPRSRVGVALLIGNWDYWNTPLNSVKSDLQNMSETLRSAGFVVRATENLRSPRQFQDALDELLKSNDVTAEDVLLVYYSGHGLQIDGKAQLLGTGVSATARVEDFRDGAYSAETLIAQMERAAPSTRLLIVEACRNDLLVGGQSTNPTAKGGFAFQQDDVPNTFVMFANRPGATTPVRSEYGLMGPFTEALVNALEHVSGDILEVFEAARIKTIEISPSQEPVLYRSKDIERVVLRPRGAATNDARARTLLNGAEPAYQHRAWGQFQDAVTRARVFASDGTLKQRLTAEIEFVSSVIRAESAEQRKEWNDAAANWEKAARLFPAREWVALRAGTSWLLGDDIVKGLQTLSGLAAQSDSELAGRARRMTEDLTAAYPAIKDDAQKVAEQTSKLTITTEFERVEKRDQP